MAGTKKVKLLVAFSGQWSGEVGDVVERPSEEADRFIAKGFAEAMPTSSRSKKTREKATANDDRETAVLDK